MRYNRWMNSGINISGNLQCNFVFIQCQESHVVDRDEDKVFIEKNLQLHSLMAQKPFKWLQ